MEEKTNTAGKKSAENMRNPLSPHSAAILDGHYCPFTRAVRCSSRCAVYSWEGMGCAFAVIADNLSEMREDGVQIPTFSRKSDERKNTGKGVDDGTHDQRQGDPE